jgi:hypothetical protein
MAVMFVGGNENTPYVKKTNAGGRTTLVQDPSKYYINKGYEDLSTKNANAKTSSGGSSTTATKPVSGGGGGSTGGDSGSVGFDWSAYMAELQRQRQAAADAAYQRNMDRIASAYNSAAGNLKSNFDSTQSRLNAARDQSMGDVNNDAEKSLQQAYINKMLTNKNINQRLSAMGYNGGATESTMAQLENNYGNSRNNINTTLNDNINKLNMTYGDNLANALQSYNSAMSNLDLQRMQLEMQAENARQNAIDAQMSSFSSLMGGDSSYLSALQAALANQSNYTYDNTKATNDYVAGNVQQNASAASGANYAKYLQQAQLEASNGANRSAVLNMLFNAVSKGDLDLNAAYDIINRYYQ